jgi:hypothetical protein
MYTFSVVGTKTHSVTASNITTLSIKTFSIMTLSKMEFMI